MAALLVFVPIFVTALKLFVVFFKIMINFLMHNVFINALILQPYLQYHKMLCFLLTYQMTSHSVMKF